MTITEILNWAKGALSESDNALFEAQVILAHILQCEQGYLYQHSNQQLTQQQQAQFEALIKRRQDQEPLAYLLGYKEFWNLKLKITKDTIIPRLNTELIVKITLLKLPKEQSLRVLDLGTGCGAIACALASERSHWHILGSDVSAKALAVAQENVQSLGFNNIQFTVSDWFSSLQGEKFDAIISNPPYIRSQDLSMMHGDKLFEPKLAYTAGPSGYEAVSGILIACKTHLNPNGMLAIEHSFDQAEKVRHLFHEIGLKNIESFHDQAGNERVTLGYYLP